MASYTKPEDDQVLVEQKSSTRVIILNRTRQLNALSFYMSAHRKALDMLNTLGMPNFVLRLVERCAKHSGDDMGLIYIYILMCYVFYM
ncbi:hypothetical protein HN51_040422 [Arachis hypogaea]|uniref:membrin-11-like n=1 Tax=Arachis hypogaea TaxID=3818 RepID=UPI003B225F36